MYSHSPHLGNKKFRRDTTIFWWIYKSLESRDHCNHLNNQQFFYFKKFNIKETITTTLVIKSHVIHVSSFYQKRSNPGNYLLVKKPEQEETADKPLNLILAIQWKVIENGSLHSACNFHYCSLSDVFKVPKGKSRAKKPPKTHKNTSYPKDYQLPIMGKHLLILIREVTYSHIHSDNMPTQES